jgi:hypothetical protein
MDLPEDVVRLIKEYTRPLTRPDWRTLHRMTLRVFIDDYKDILRKRQTISFEKFLKYNRIYTLQRYYRLFGWTLSF